MLCPRFLQGQQVSAKRAATAAAPTPPLPQKRPKTTSPGEGISAVDALNRELARCNKQVALPEQVVALEAQVAALQAENAALKQKAAEWRRRAVVKDDMLMEFWSKQRS